MGIADHVALMGADQEVLVVVVTAMTEVQPYMFTQGGNAIGTRCRSNHFGDGCHLSGVEACSNLDHRMECVT
jgi:hypothetical protein